MPEVSDFDLQQILSGLCERNPRLVLTHAAVPLHIQSDQQYLSIALGNLLDNALKYSPPTSQVQVTCAPCGQTGRDGVCVQVTNDVGQAGWPDPERLFQKYYRNPAAQHHIGSGLGLYLVKGLLDLLACTIRYKPQPHTQPPQVVFEVHIPLMPTIGR